MNQSSYLRLPSRGHIAHATIMAVVPLAVSAALFVHGPAARPVPVADSATMWLASARGELVRANGLVSRPADQIVETVAYAAAAFGVRLTAQVPAAVYAAGPGGVTRVDTRRDSVTAAPGGTVVGVGSTAYLVAAHTVARLDLQTADVRRLDGITAAAAGPDALYVATAACLSRVDATGAHPVRVDGHPTLLDGVDDGVTTYDAGSGVVSLVRGGSAKIAGKFGTGPETVFATAPDGRGFAAVAGNELRVLADGREQDSTLGFTPGVAVFAGRTLLLGDAVAGKVHVLRLAEELREDRPLDYGTPGAMDLDVHRRSGSVWLDDVRGPIAYAVHDGTPTRIVEYTVTSPPPSTAPSPTTPPPTTPPHTTPPQTTPPHTTRPPTAPPRTTPPHSTRPTTQAPDPRAKCDGHDASLDVGSPTGPDPEVHVRVCVEAGDDQYWTVTRNDGGSYAKSSIGGSVGTGTHTVHLLHDSGLPGQSRRFYVVAARTGGARDRLENNNAADVAGTSFDRGSLPDDVDEISAPIFATS